MIQARAVLSATTAILAAGWFVAAIAQETGPARLGQIGNALVEVGTRHRRSR